MEKEVISNASSIIFIGKLKIFELVKNLYSRIFLPKEVIHEIFEYDRPENQLIKREIDGGFIEEINVKEIRQFPLHAGEKAAISLCIEKKIPLFISDDKKARKYARYLNLNTIGILGIVLENLKLNKINKNQAKKLIKDLVDCGYFMSPKLYMRVQELIDNFA